MPRDMPWNMTLPRKRKKAGYLRLAIEKLCDRHSRHWSWPKTEGSAPSEVSFAPDRNFATWLKWCPCRCQVLPVFKVSHGFQKCEAYPQHIAMIFVTLWYIMGIIDETFFLKHGMCMDLWGAIFSDRPTCASQTCGAHIQSDPIPNRTCSHYFL